MLRIQRLVHPTHRSGYKLEPGKTTKVRGLAITNTNKFPIYVDKYTRKKYHIARKKKVAKAKKK